MSGVGWGGRVPRRLRKPLGVMDMCPLDCGDDFYELHVSQLQSIYFDQRSYCSLFLNKAVNLL